MQWTLEQLRQFVAAAQAGSFSAAARQLGRAQSAVSTSVGLLEADLGVELFDRSRRNATLTPAGEVMLQEARELLRQAGGLEQRALAFAGGRDARLSIALDEALPHLVLGALLKELAERFPALELTQLNGTATEVADYLRQGRASLAFHLDRGDPGPSFAHRRLGDVAQGIFVARGHPLAALPAAGRSDLALPSLLFYLAAYAVTNVAAFAVTAALPEHRELADYRGLARARPGLGLALLVALLGLVGTPPLAVFVGKLTTATAAWDGGHGWLALVVMLNSVLSLFYYLRWFAPVFARPDQHTAGFPGRGGAAAWPAVTAGVAAVASLVLGVLAGVLWAALEGPVVM